MRKKYRTLTQKELNAREMIKAVKAGDWQAYSKWLQQCELKNTLEEIDNQ